MPPGVRWFKRRRGKGTVDLRARSCRGCDDGGNQFVRGDFYRAFGADHRRELLPATRALREVKLIPGEFVGVERPLAIGGEDVRVRAVGGRGGIAGKAAAKQPVHRLVVVPSSHETILLR